jgi:UDP-N-acetylglucosamine--N-acetylmuramyl-(pentapeptide) pyrophosphoryl-undecaprenol N-acetylglucosamine transferase
VRVLIAGGGTAGHVFPALALARCLSAHGAEVAFVGTDRGLEAKLVPAAGFPFTAVEARPFVRNVSLAAARAPISAIRSIRRCRPLVQGVDVVVGVGGYASGPAVLAAARARRPVVLHEQNAVPGLANRVLSRVARRIALSFPEAESLLPRSARRRVVVTGNPVRAEVAAVRERRTELAGEARRELELAEGRRTVVILGGSQGAVHLDRAALGAIERLSHRQDLQFLLLTGPAHHAMVSDHLPGRGSLIARAIPFLDRMELAYTLADLVVSRAGATTIAELAICGIPSVLVPYPYATGRHQEANARAIERAGAATILMDEDLTASTLADRISGLVDDTERLTSMARAAERWSRPEAAEELARVIRGAAG